MALRERSVQNVAGQSVWWLSNDVARSSELSLKDDFFYWDDVDAASYLGMENPIPPMESKDSL